MWAGFSERLKEARLLKKKTQQEFADLMGVSIKVYQRYEAGSATPGTDKLAKLSSQLKDLNVTYLLRGAGPIIGNEAEEKQVRRLENLQAQLDLGNYRFVPLLRSQVTAGPEGEILYEDINDYYPFKAWWIEKLVGKSEERKKELLLLRVRGDSMMPTINPGEMALVDTSDQARLETKPGRIYLVLRPDGTTALKRVVLNKEEGKPKIVCLSDNPAQTPFEIEVDPGTPLKRYILGRVVWVGKEFY